jgi:proteasome lid subunit RPN8/RPN11
MGGILRLLLRLNQSQANLLTKEAYHRKPMEACALLFGESDKDVYNVKKVVVAPNILNSRIQFEINPLLVVAESEKAEKEGLELVGFFHSHPAPPYPSEIDIRNMKLWTNTLWLIFSLTEDKFATFMFINKILEEIPLIINSDSKE